MWSAMTDAERRVLAVLNEMGSATRAQVVDACELPVGDAEHSLDTLWCAGFIGCATTYFVAVGENAPDDWRYSVYSRGQAALAEAA